jgi:uncharacterized protein (UPF0248 family)
MLEFKDLTIREILNRILWDQRKKKADYVLTFIHRGAHMNRKVIPFNLIREVKASWFSYGREDEEVIIPFHRILEVKNVKNGKLIWEKTSVELKH